MAGMYRIQDLIRTIDDNLLNFLLQNSPRGNHVQPQIPSTSTDLKVESVFTPSANQQSSVAQTNNLQQNGSFANGLPTLNSGMHFGKLPPNSFMLSNPFNVAGNGVQYQSSPFVNIGGGLDQSSSYLNPLLNMTALRQQGEQFVGPGIGQLLNGQENLNLLNALLKQQSGSRTSTAPNAQRISTLLTEQQAREAEAHRLQFLDFNALHTNSVAGPSTSLIGQESNKLLGNQISYNIPKLPVFKMVEDQSKSENSAATSNFGVLPHQPYYPTHFMRGTHIQTSNDTKKLVETLKGEDFLNVSNVATLAHQKEMCVGVVMSLKPVEPNVRYVDVVFKTETLMENGDLEISTWTISSPIEYPFFEVNKRWSSFSPTKSLNLYGIECAQLKVGDRCLVLTSDQGSTNLEPTVQRLSPIPETSSRSDSQLSVASTENRRVAYFCTEDVIMDDHVII